MTTPDKVMSGPQIKLIFGLACAFLSIPHAEAEQIRSQAVLREFQRLHPCPSTSQPVGKCPGWIKDHIIALACGGADAVDNLQWQTVADAKAKDRIERKGSEPRQK